jgi:hypothetical protein
MRSPVAADELVAAVEAEIAAGAAWVKIIGDAPEWGADGPVPGSAAATEISTRCARRWAQPMPRSPDADVRRQSAQPARLRETSSASTRRATS